MKEVQGNITRMDTTSVKDNQILALSVNRQDVERCTRVIRQYGLLSLPVIGSFQDGTQLVLSGECEFLALKELGVHNVEAVMVSILEKEESDKLSLLLSSLRKTPNALSEGILITQLLKTGRYSQLELGELLGKSSSWISKRISLMTRLDPAVREMVTKKLLCSHSAQEISRLPYEVQHDFSVRVVQEGLPKSSVETLVCAFNKEDCSSALKDAILAEPRHALTKVERSRTIKPIHAVQAKELPASSKALRNDLVLMLHCIKDAGQQLGSLKQEELGQLQDLILRTKSGILRFCTLLEAVLEHTEFSLGKTVEEVMEHAH